MLLHSPWPDVSVPAMLASCLSFLDSASFSDSLTDIRPRCDNQLSLPTESQGYFIFTPFLVVPGNLRSRFHPVTFFRFVAVS